MGNRLEGYSPECFEQLRLCPSPTTDSGFGASAVSLRNSLAGIEPDSDYVVYLGSNETHGCFVEQPFSSILEESTGVQSINLGCVDCRIDGFLNSDEILRHCRGSRLVVMEIMGAEAMSNRLYRVDKRYNTKFVRASKYLKALYSDLDFSQFSTVYELLTALAQSSREKLFFVRTELHLAWVARMRTLIEKVGSPVLLLWISDHIPYQADIGGTVFREPFFVDSAMIEELRGEVVEILEFVAQRGEIRLNRTGASIHSDSSPVNVYMGANFHRRVAAELAPILDRILRDPSGKVFSNTPTAHAG